MEELISLLCIKHDFRGWWSATPTNRGRPQKTQGGAVLKSGDSSLAIGSYLQIGRVSDMP